MADVPELLRLMDEVHAGRAVDQEWGGLMRLTHLANGRRGTQDLGFRAFVFGSFGGSVAV